MRCKCRSAAGSCNRAETNVLHWLAQHERAQAKAPHLEQVAHVQADVLHAQVFRQELRHRNNTSTESVAGHGSNMFQRRHPGSIPLALLGKMYASVDAVSCDEILYLWNHSSAVMGNATGVMWFLSQLRPRPDRSTRNDSPAGPSP